MTPLEYWGMPVMQCMASIDQFAFQVSSVGVAAVIPDQKTPAKRRKSKEIIEL